MELALEPAPVRDAQQEVGIGGGLKFLDLRLRPGQLRLQPANRRLGAVGTLPAAGFPGRMTAVERFFARKPRFWDVFRPWRRSPWFSSS